MKRYRITFAVLAFLAVVGVFFSINNYINASNQNAQLYKYSSQEAALIDGIIQNADATIQQKHPLDNILLSKVYNGNLYAVIKVPFYEYEIIKDYVYVAVVKEKNDGFCFIKLSPDISLNTMGDIKDVDYTPNATFYFDNIEGLYFLVGKIYDEHYKPYFNGTELQLFNGNIYAFIQENERPLIEIVKVN